MYQSHDHLQSSDKVSLYRSLHMHVLTIIITDFNCDSIWFNTTHGNLSTSFKSTDKGLARFSNVIIDDWYQKWVQGTAFKAVHICEVKLGSSCKVKVSARDGCKQDQGWQCAVIVPSITLMLERIHPLTWYYISRNSFGTYTTNCYWCGVESKSFTEEFYCQYVSLNYRNGVWYSPVNQYYCRKHCMRYQVHKW